MYRDVSRNNLSLLAFLNIIVPPGNIRFQLFFVDIAGYEFRGQLENS